jgi:hypothetical protein
LRGFIVKQGGKGKGGIRKGKEEYFNLFAFFVSQLYYIAAQATGTSQL